MADYQCIKCGYVVTGQSSTPSTNPNWNGTCPATATGKHIWQRMGRYIKQIMWK